MRSHSIKLNCVLALVLAGAFLARAASAAFVPNLTYTTPSGWSSPLVVATTPGQTVDSSTLPPFPNDRTLYVSLALTNNGNGAAGAFVVQLLVDGTVVQTANVPGLSVNTNFTIPDLQVSQITATGDHTFQVNINPTHTVTETNYSDNAYTRTVTISTSLPNLTYVTPAGWSGPLVVATSTGSTQDSTSTPPYPTDAVLYAEMAIVNNGTQDAGPFDLVLQLDSVEVQRFHAPGLAQGAQYTQTDINLGSQARGTHSLSMLIDPGNAVVEYTKSDNTFIRTIQALYPMPTFTSGTVSDATCGTFWSYQILAAPNITSYNAANLPGWMNINTSTGLISGTPPLDSAGPQNTTANITVAASDLDFTNSQPVYVTIHPAPPIITSTLSWNAQAGVPMATYTISCAGSPATLNAAPLPAGLSFASPDISGTPTISGTFWVTLTAQNAGGTDTQTLSIGITPGAPAKLAFGQQPGSTGNILAGAGITPAVTVLIQDANGNTVTSNSNVTVAIGTNPGGGTLGGTTTVAAVSGVATFSGLSIDKMGTGYTLVAASSTLTGATSNPFNILGPPAKLAFGQGPGNTVAGASIAPAVTVLVQDANGYTVTNDTSSVTLAIGMNAGGGTLSGTKTVAAVSGVATFSGLSIDKTGTGYTLAATDGTLTSATSNAFNITSGGTVATPTFSPAAGTYSSAQSVTIATTTSGAAIYYTTDGSLPTTSSTKYTGAINVAATTTLKAYAVNAGMSDSTVASAAYTINSAPPAPVITSATTATGTTGVAFTYSITASNSPTSYNAAGLPAGLSVNMSTGAITGTPTAAGNSSVAISATNAGGTGTATLALTIVVPPPVITSATTASGTIGVAFSFQITASNSPASYTATGLPGGLSVDQAKGIISGTPTAALATDVAISAANAGGTGSGTLHLTITGQAAALTSQLTATGTVGQAFTYTITASGATPMTFSAQPLPNGLNLSGATLSGTPTAAGQTSVTIGASNSSGSDNKTLQLTINPAGAPTITSALTATGQAGTAFSYQIKANGDTPLQ
ncbi:MAG: putative Ig domain-containing protein, partial [Planctomycetota bacterium]